MRPKAPAADVDNPMGTDGFEFVEYAAPDPQLLRALFERMGFPAVARHRSRTSRCTSRATSTSSSMPSPTASRRASRAARPLRVRDGVSRQGCRAALEHAVSSGATAVPGRSGADGAEHPGHRGHRREPPLSGRPLRRRARSTTSISCSSRAGRSACAQRHGLTLHRPSDAQRAPRQHGRRGREFYERLFGFREIRYFDIEGKETGLISQGDDEPVRQDPHPAERKPGRQEPGRGVPARLQRRGHPAHRARHRATSIARVDRLRAARRRAAGHDPTPTTTTSTSAWPGHGETGGGAAPATHPDRRRAGSGEGMLLQIFTGT